MELLQDSDSSSVAIGPHWPSSYPEYLSPNQDKDKQRRVVWARLLSQHSNLASRLSKQNERYQALCQELNPRMTPVESSHDPLYRDRPLQLAWKTPCQGHKPSERLHKIKARAMSHSEPRHWLWPSLSFGGWLWLASGLWARPANHY